MISVSPNHQPIAFSRNEYFAFNKDTMQVVGPAPSIKAVEQMIENKGEYTILTKVKKVLAS